MSETLNQANGELVPIADLALARMPEAVTADATRAANALQRIIASKAKPVIINGEQYLEYEDWATVASFFSTTAKVVSTAPLTIGNATGWEARAVALLVPTGQEISAADAMCMSDEPRWRDRPSFQLRSMAQTRACAKALRNVFSRVVVLAGYRPTPAEEMDGVKPTAVPTEDAKPQPAAAPRPATNGKAISEAQQKRLFAIAREAGWTADELKNWLLTKYHVQHSAEITRDQYEAIVDAVRGGTEAA